eukprot:scaffold127332_cov42-Phaeocystis_antarctica.AAC.1
MIPSCVQLNLETIHRKTPVGTNKLVGDSTEHLHALVNTDPAKPIHMASVHRKDTCRRGSSP